MTPSLVKRWRELFPALDIGKECREALAWIEANPERRKTARGMKSYLTRWFSRAQNQGRGQNGTAAKPAPKFEPIAVRQEREREERRDERRLELLEQLGGGK